MDAKAHRLFVACGAAVALAAIVPGVVSCSGNGTAPAGRSAASMSVQDRVARALAEVSPPADPADAKARDAAAEKLSHLDALLNTTGDRVLWSGYDPAKGCDPAAYNMTAFHPRVWAKLYVSTFMFPGAYEVRQEGRFTVLEMAAKFRDRLDSGDYPYPFWHSQKKWAGYVDADALLLVFEGDRLIAAYRKVAPMAAAPLPTKVWDGRWHWTDETGVEQPRVALFAYLLSPDNPHKTSLDSSYRRLEERFRAQNCIGCHAPDNTAHADTLLLLNYPNQALAGRHSLTAMLRGNKMPPENPAAGSAAGIHDENVRHELIKLAEEFEKEADAALAFEDAKK